MLTFGKQNKKPHAEQKATNDYGQAKFEPAYVQKLQDPPKPPSNKNILAKKYVNMPDDLIADSKGVYGYLPKEESQFHSSKWPVDWTDKIQVGKARETRLKYHSELEKKKELVNTLRTQGISEDGIARKLVEARNTDRLSHYKTPESLDAVYNRNLEKYDNIYGPTYESQLAKYDNSPKKVIDASLRSNDSVDILTGIAKPKGGI